MQTHISQNTQRVAASHELHVMQLEQEVNELCQRQGIAARYPLTVEQDPMARHAMAKVSAQLLESDEGFRSLLESLDDGFCILEKVGGEAGELLDFRCVEANTAFARHTGLRDVAGKTLRQALPDEFEDLIHTCAVVYTSGEPKRFERPFKALGRVLELYVFRVADESRGRVAIHLQDVTERKQAKQLLRQNHDTFFNLIENAPFGLFVVDAQFRLRQASTASRKVFSNTEPLIGRDFEEVLRLVRADPFASEALGHFRHTLQTGEPYAAPNTTGQRQNIPDVESYDWKIERITLPDGQFGVVCYFYGITEGMRAEHALRESEAFCRSIITSSPDCIKVLDLHGNLLSMQSGQELLGIEDIQPFLNKSWIDFWTGGHRLAAQTAIESAAARGVGNFVGYFRTLRGEAKWWDVMISPILAADGKPARLLAVSRDVTRRRRAELNFEFLAAVSRDLAQWRSVDDMMQTVGAKMAAYFQLSLCAFVEINETAEQVAINHDWHREDVPSLVGVHRLADFVGDKFIQMARAGDAIVVADVATDPRTEPGQFAALKIASFVCMPLIRDMQWRFALCLYKSVAYDWQEDEIELTRELAARIWTRMERIRAEAALRQSELRYRNLFNSIDEGFAILEIIFDEEERAVDYRFLEVNPAFEKQTGLTDATGKRVSEVSPDLGAEGLEIYVKVLQSGESVRYVSESKALGRWLDVYATALGEPGARTIAIVLNDISERTEAEAQRERLAGIAKDTNIGLANATAVAVRASLAKSEFLSQMSHELRTPLGSILGFAQLIDLGSPPPTPGQKRSLDQILQAGWYLLTLINEILDLTQIESGKLVVATEPVSLTDVLRECGAMVSPQAQLSGITVSFSALPMPYQVQADRTRLKQVLINLLSNAIKYNKPGGAVLVTCVPGTPGRIRISVADTGAGLSRDEISQLFQPFNRLGQAGSAQAGTGIGLVVAKQLAELMDGSIGVQSTVGQGSVFSIDIGLTERLALVAIAQAPLRTVLYVEDNPAYQMLVADLLARRLDLRLLSAKDGNTGINIARACLPDVILMDINLPGMSGTEALMILAKDPATAHIPVLAISANAMPRDIEKGLQAGFFRYISKPVKIDELLDALDDALTFSQKTSGASAQAAQA